MRDVAGRKRRSWYWLLFVLVVWGLAGCAADSFTPQDEEQPDGDVSDGDGDEEQPDGDVSDGDGPDPLDGDTLDGDVSDGDIDGDGDQEDEQEEEIERIDLETVEGCNPFTVRGDCLLPFPNMWFMVADPSRATGWRGNFPADMIQNKTGDSHFDIDAANAADGCSPVSPILIHFGVDIHPEQLTPHDELERSLSPDSPIALFNMETGKRVLTLNEMDLNRHYAHPDRSALIIRPLEPMQMGARHVVALTQALMDSEGKGFDSPPAFAVLRDRVFTTNPVIEAARPAYEEVFLFLEAGGYPRDELFLAWDFVVASEDFILGPILSMRETALEMSAGTGLAYVVEEILEAPNDNVSRIIQGRFEVPNFLNAESAFDYDERHRPLLQDETTEYPFTIIVPKVAETVGKPLPLVVFGHGIFGTGRSYLTGGLGRRHVQPLANENELIIIATDWIGLAGGDMEIIVNQVISDMNKIGLVTDRLQQSLVNNLVLTELAVGGLNEDEALRVAAHPLIDTSKVYYFGVSLGGIQGASFLSLFPHIDRAVLVVPGGGWSTMLPRSLIWGDIQLFFNAEYPDPLTRQVAVAFMQARFDHSDPVNLSFAPELLGDSGRKREILMQQAIGDSLIPNMSTELLGRALGVALMEPSITLPTGFELVQAPTGQPVMVQYLMPDLVAANPPPVGNLPPLRDNTVHYEVVFLDNVFQQVQTFLGTGETHLYCDGACDPD